ncbi:MAG: pyridoxal phosphate-dependent aminotransferase family protein [Candidatus Bipolaricaulis sp.]|nr:pyridoxal phosphate-dependent aminotransferase family protein [Candidatus Bipolaricaulis sp.]
MENEPARMSSPVGARATVNGRTVDYFCGTSYFGLHGHPQVIAAARDALATYGVGTATAAWSPAHADVVEETARYLGTETVTYVASGYLAPLVLLQALSDDYDLAFADAASHYGILDALRAVGKDVVLFRHLDPDDLARRLALGIHGGKRPLVVTDGVFPSTGSLAPLRAYVDALARYPKGLLCIDDAHALGVIGETGRGSVEYHSIDTTGVYVCGTLSKAFGGAGGIVPGNEALAARVRRASRVPSGASLPSVPDAAASAMGLRILSLHPEMRQALWTNVRLVRDGLRTLGFNLADTPIPIVSLRGRRSINLLRVQEALARRDILVHHAPPHGYSDSPSVETLRVAVFSTHTPEQIERLIDAVRRAV